MHNSKAKVLHSLANEKLTFKIPDLISFTVKDFQKNEELIFNKIQKKFKCDFIAIRSSAFDEDSYEKSSAGEYLSVLNVPVNNRENLKKSILDVINSYIKRRSINLRDEIIVQEMINDCSMSGVIFTHDLNSGAPYYVVNYDDISGNTDTVTSGKGSYSNRTLWVFRDSIDKLRSDRFYKLILCVSELELLLKDDSLDIEFVVDKSLNFYLLQVRPITSISKKKKDLNRQILSTLKSTEKTLDDLFNAKDGVYGQTSVLGQMPDWNPVEMIGRAPRALASSLYKKLITDNTWLRAREIMGYAVPSQQNLMVFLAGQPFIDTRLSFHSYLPANLDPIISEKLVNHWVNELKNKPHNHDKIEFEIAITSYSFDFKKKLNLLVGEVLSENEKESFRLAHLEQTIKLITGRSAGSIKKALDKIDQLANYIEESKKRNTGISEIIDKCLEFGTLQFAILARHGFIAITILNSIKNIDIINGKELDHIKSDIHTISSDFLEDLSLLNEQSISKDDFLIKYGHLRPGTYDIRQLRYDQMETVFLDSGTMKNRKNKTRFNFNQRQKKLINKQLGDLGFIDFNSEDLLDYIHSAISAREYGKFIFTKCVSHILELAAEFGKKYHYGREQISHLSIDEIINLSKDKDSSIIDKVNRQITKSEEEYKINYLIRLPQLVFDKAGLFVIPFQVSQPNFITQKKITAPILNIDSNRSNPRLSGKIVLIEGADPGFDWIFSKNIGGLITKHGGINSHMAIRCAEFGVPAAIGCGEQRYESLLNASSAFLDCLTGVITPSNL